MHTSVSKRQKKPGWNKQNESEVKTIAALLVKPDCSLSHSPSFLSPDHLVTRRWHCAVRRQAWVPWLTLTLCSQTGVHWARFHGGNTGVPSSQQGGQDHWWVSRPKGTLLYLLAVFRMVVKLRARIGMLLLPTTITNTLPGFEQGEKILSFCHLKSFIYVKKWLFGCWHYFWSMSMSI